MMGVRFEVDVERSAAGFRTGCFKGENFRVLHARVGVGSGANDGAVCIGDDGSDVGIGRREADAGAGEFECVMEKLIFVGVIVEGVIGGVSGHSGRGYHEVRGKIV